ARSSSRTVLISCWSGITSPWAGPPHHVVRPPQHRAPQGLPVSVVDCAAPALRTALENGPYNIGEVWLGTPSVSWPWWTGTLRPEPTHTRSEPAPHTPGTAQVAHPGWTGLRQLELGHRCRRAPRHGV